MDSDTQRLIEEMRRVPAPTGGPRAGRLALLQRLIEADPPRLHGYGAIDILATFSTIAGVTVMLIGLIGLAMAAAGPMPTMESGQPGLVPELRGWMDAISLASAAVPLCFTGFGLILSGQWMRLWMDLQQNADRQSFALHGIFQLLLAQRKDGDDGKPDASRDR